MVDEGGSLKCTGFAPEKATVSPLITGDRCYTLLLVGTTWLSDVGTILALQGSRGLCGCRSVFCGCIVELLQE